MIFGVLLMVAALYLFGPLTDDDPWTPELFWEPTEPKSVGKPGEIGIFDRLVHRGGRK